MTTTKTMLILAGLLIAGAADAQTDSLRCDARQMRAESQYYRCLSRCDRRADRNAARPEERQRDVSQSDCETKCTTHYEDDLARIAQTPTCSRTTVGMPADPQECESHVLRLMAVDLRCQARCTRERRREGFDQTACLAGCQTRCETSQDEILARPVCDAGRIGTTDPCATH